MNKKIILICVCIFIFFICFSSLEVLASNQQIFSYTTSSHDDANGNYLIKYRRYGVTGLMEGEIHLPDDMHNTEHWAILLRNDGQLVYAYHKNPSLNHYYGFFITYGWPNVCSLVGDYDGNGCVFGYRIYDFETNTWSDSSDTSKYGLVGYNDANYYIASNIIITKDCPVKFGYGNVKVLYQQLDKGQVYTSPHMKTLVNQGFRLCLNDFFSYTDVTDDGELTAGLTSVKVTVYDMVTHSYYTEAENALVYRDVEQDSEGNYYIDLLYDDFLQYLKTTSGDYIIGIKSDLTVNYSSNLFSSIEERMKKFYITKNVYQAFDFYRYKYNADTGIGELTPVDENGNPINPDEPQPTPDLTQQAIKEQTDAIKEQTEVSKNIFQQIIELPRKNNRRTCECNQVLVYS